jgi:signal transduction histidine kinase
MLIAISAILMAYFWHLGSYPINLIIWTGITVLLVMHTTYYIYKILEGIDQYLVGLRNRDFSNIPLKYYKWGKLAELRRVMEEIQNSYKSYDNRNSAESEILKSAISLAPVGILMWSSSGEIVIFNNAIKQLLNLEGVPSTERLEKLRPLLFKKLSKIEVGYSGLLEYESGDKKNKISARKSQIKASGKVYTLILLQLLNREIERAETQAWERLMKIMTHEIMNSITSVHSLSSTLKSLIEAEDKESSVRAVNSIEKRSGGLLQFVKDYRTLTEIPSPQLEKIDFSEFLIGFKKEIDHINPAITIDLDANSSTFALADPEQLRLVLTNLYLNSNHALNNTSDPQIRISSKKESESTVLIQFTDNGMGMSKSTLDDAFVPFYTTRKDGSGIGLPLSRQLIRAMGGRLNLESKEGEGCTAKISLKKAVLGELN